MSPDVVTTQVLLLLQRKKPEGPGTRGRSCQPEGYFDFRQRYMGQKQDRSNLLKIVRENTATRPDIAFGPSRDKMIRKLSEAKIAGTIGPRTRNSPHSKKNIAT